MRLHATIFTLFPQMFPGCLGHALSGRALDKKIWDYRTVDLREFSLRKDKRVDDRPYGGGAGMVISADVIDRALTHHCGSPETLTKPLIYFSPRGQMFDSEMAKTFSQNETEIFLLAGRYEGIDQRVIDKWQMQEICIGPYILSGGELAAQIFLDAIIRLLPDVLGNPESLDEESFSDAFTYEYPHYTRPPLWQGRAVPHVLLSGNHQQIEEWHQEQSLLIKKDKKSDDIGKKTR